MGQFLKKMTITAIILLIPLPHERAKADMFGGDVAVLIEILANNIQQLYQLMEIVEKGKDSLNLMKDINRGLNSALETIQDYKNESHLSLYSDLTRVSHALQALERMYGSAPNTALKNLQDNTDRSVAEAISLGNDLMRYSEKLDDVGKNIKSHSQRTSPKGAAKLTAQSMGVLVESMNQSIRAQSVALKLKAQEMAADNHREKQESKEFVRFTRGLSKNFKTQNTLFAPPIF